MSIIQIQPVVSFFNSMYQGDCLSVPVLITVPHLVYAKKVL